MKDAELNRILKSAAAPSRPAGYWEDFPGRVTRAMQRPMPRERRTSQWLPRLAWAFGLAAACVVAGFVAGQHWGQTDMAANGQVLQSEKLIREVMGMFPNRVRAIVKDEAGMQLVLSDAEDVPDSTPLWVKVCEGDRCTTLVTFSGQELKIAGQRMTVLSDAKGGVILEGDRFAWASAGKGASPTSLKIQAKPLQFASLK